MSWQKVRSDSRQKVFPDHPCYHRSSTVIAEEFSHFSYRSAGDLLIKQSDDNTVIFIFKFLFPVKLMKGSMSFIYSLEAVS